MAKNENTPEEEVTPTEAESSEVDSVSVEASEDSVSDVENTEDNPSVDDSEAADSEVDDSTAAVDIEDLVESTEDKNDPAPKTGVIDVDSLSEISGDFYAEEFEVERRQKPSRLKFIAIILGFLLLGVAVGMGPSIVHSIMNNDKTPGISEEVTDPNSDETVDPQDLDPTELTQAVVSNTTDALAKILSEQYGEEALGSMQIASGTDTADKDGKPATVALASIFGVPADVDADKTFSYFTESIKSFDGDWRVEHDTSITEGIKSNHTIVMKDYEENPSNPVIISISIFQLEGEDTMTITVEATVY
jgi:hypothetical protein